MLEKRGKHPACVAGGNGYFLLLRKSRCSSKHRRFASNRRNVLSASNVSTPAALKRTMRPFCCCMMRCPSATSSSARRRSFSESIYRNNGAAAKRCRPDSVLGGVRFAPGHCELAKPDSPFTRIGEFVRSGVYPKHAAAVEYDGSPCRIACAGAHHPVPVVAPTLGSFEINPIDQGGNRQRAPSNC